MKEDKMKLKILCAMGVMVLHTTMGHATQLANHTFVFCMDALKQNPVLSPGQSGTIPTSNNAVQIQAIVCHGQQAPSNCPQQSQTTTCNIGYYPGFETANLVATSTADGCGITISDPAQDVSKVPGSTCTISVVQSSGY